MGWFARTLVVLLGCLPGLVRGDAPAPPVLRPGPVYILPIRDDIMPPLTYVVRRVVKDAMAAGAPLLVLDIHTNGGRVDVTEEIIGILGRFPGRVVAYVNTRAFSAGAFISVAAAEIHMAPQSVIGAAAPVAVGPGGGMEKLPETYEAKMTSAIRAMVRTQAEKNGHDVRVIEAMIDRGIALEIDGEVLNREGSLLTLTDQQAAKTYGDPPRPLLSAGTRDSIESLLAHLGHADSPVVRIEPTGTEKLGTWINKLAPVLLILGILGLYIEFKTPGFGLPGILGITAFAIYFLGGYVAGLSAAGWLLVFIVGVALILLELLVFPGTFIAGITGATLALVALVMAMVDAFPGGPVVPTLPELQLPIRNLGLGLAGSAVLIVVLARLLPHTPLYRGLLTDSASGVASVAAIEERQTSELGREGTTLTPLTPGGRARFGDALVDVVTHGERVERGRPVRIVGHSSGTPVVEEQA